MGRPRSPVEPRFWAKVDRRGLDECWLWTAARSTYGYGVFQLPDGTARGRWASAHRVAYALTYGEPSGYVLHHCDVRLCCNPAHLYDGTPADNVRDMRERGRAVYVRGERHGQSKLTDAQRLSIALSEGRSVTSLAQEYGVSRRTISRIRQR